MPLCGVCLSVCPSRLCILSKQIVIFEIFSSSGNHTIVVSHFINDIDKGIVSRLLKFADDTKLVGTVCTEVELEQLRTDLKLLYSYRLANDI